MKTVCTMVIMLTVWASPAQAVRNAERGATRKQDASPLVLTVQLSLGDRAVAEANPRLRRPLVRSRRMVPKLGPAPKVHVAAEQIVDAVRSAEARGGGDVLIVDCSGEGDHTTIQAGIDAASDGDVIIVLPNTCNEVGHYFENINFLGKGITVQSIFPADVNVLDATVINGSLLDSVVTFDNGEGQDSVLDGLTITGGLGASLDLFDDSIDAPIHWGGGVICIDSSPTIRNCRIIGNQATHGGGIACAGGQPTFISCDISENSTNVEPAGSFLWLPFGGGLAIWNGSAILRGCRIHNNLVDASFEDDLLNGSGAGISFMSAAVEQQQHLEITGCVVSTNEMNGDPEFFLNGAGGGLWSWQFDPASEAHVLAIKNSMILDNLATSDGAGLLIGNGIVADIQGTTVAGNHAEGPFGNGIGGAGGVVVALRNSIIHHNSPMDLHNAGVDFTFEYSDVGTASGGEVTGPGNISADPLFADAENGDYHVTADSPCIDLGDPDFVPAEGETDIDGDARIVGERVDMGADEFRDLCADDDGDGRVTICHIPPGNPDNARTITISVRALTAHLAHGDLCGPCEGDSGVLLMAGDGEACSADLNVDVVVDASDLAILLGSWGPCEGCPMDFDDDGQVDAFDLAQVLGAWGMCP